ncbi:hypothetical protein BYT27DRAFT_7313919 [Phlegmacium glaucopus]|nr:hypothetical protein BYT27DRAFT_7313919 [Phlegmacium glaucopus]
MPVIGLSPSHWPLLDPIIQSSRRWQQFELGPLSPYSDDFKRILGLSADDLCMLREIRIHSTANLTQDRDKDPWHQSGMLTAQGLRSISIAIIHPGIFPIGIPPNWKNLHHLFIHSYVALGLAGQILSYCCNLVACLLKIHRDSGHFSDVSSFLPHLKFLSLQGDPTGCNQLFCNLGAPSLRILDCRGDCPDQYKRSDLFHFLQSINSLKTLMLDDHHLTGDNALNCSILTSSLSRLVLGELPDKQFIHLLPFPNPHPEQVELMTALYKIKHQHFPDSAPTVLFPSLEVFEAYSISSVTDEILLEFIMARIDATRSKTAVSKLRKVLVHFRRTRQIDIVPEALAYARASGIELELDLRYYPEKEVAKAWSPSFGLSDEDTSWTYPLYDY